ncbi:hypothetical protein ONS95_010439 [Cadophora gregata]|uniref:uncharacterized protein n=1 Tax=Cadophora gregata TaxID=51156 RepID=UPI0026DAFA8E|nr:uncharacterized protein ONS95_010439 [Cadophora gregata]KAK0122181.1 hypothetical protein ONS95_010439 [Cadophora gregata]KAK0127662.1 hypothetical protein ONS96_007183 [Cadophora gregata f. sp. sojae]
MKTATTIVWHIRGYDHVKCDILEFSKLDTVLTANIPLSHNHRPLLDHLHHLPSSLLHATARSGNTIEKSNLPEEEDK